MQLIIKQNERPHVGNKLPKDIHDKILNKQPIDITPKNAQDVLVATLVFGDFENTLQILQKSPANIINAIKLNQIFVDYLNFSYTPLTFMIEEINNGHHKTTLYLDIIKEMLKHGGDPDLGIAKHTPSFRETALHMSCRKEKPEIVQALLTKNRVIDLKNSDGLTPLHVAASGRSNKPLQCATLLLKKDAHVNAQDNEGNTPLILCVDKEIIQLLLDYKADPKLTNKKGENLLVAHVNGFGANFTKKEYKSFIRKNKLNMTFKDANGATLLHRALRNYDEQAPTLHRNTPLFNLNDAFIEALLEMNNADFINQQDNAGYTAYDYLMLNNIEDPDDAYLYKTYINLFAKHNAKLSPAVQERLRKEEEKRNPTPSAPPMGEKTLLAMQGNGYRNIFRETSGKEEALDPPSMQENSSYSTKNNDAFTKLQLENNIRKNKKLSKDDMRNLENYLTTATQPVSEQFFKLANLCNLIEANPAGSNSAFFRFISSWNESSQPLSRDQQNNIEQLKKLQSKIVETRLEKLQSQKNLTSKEKEELGLLTDLISQAQVRIRRVL